MTDDWSNYLQESSRQAALLTLPKEVFPEYMKLASWLQAKTKLAGKSIIAVDGINNSGKSTLSRFLAWQLGLPMIETDIALVNGTDAPCYDFSLLRKMNDAWQRQNRAIIFEGIFVLQLLDAINISPETLIRVQKRCDSQDGFWPKRFRDYQAKYPRSSAPDYLLIWQLQK